MKRIIAALLLSLVALVGVSAPAVAAPNKDVTYSYPNVTLVDSNGESGSYYIAGYVRYSKNGTAKTYCDYFKSPPPEDQTAFVPVGRYVVDYAIADTSYNGVRQFCVDNFVNRTRV